MRLSLFVRQWLGLLVVLMALLSGVRAQGSLVEARVASLQGGGASLVTRQGTFPLKAGDMLKPGDVIDTRGGAQALIEMTDGSVVIVRPGTRVALKDFRLAGSLRDLFEVLRGRVRVKINHWGGKPNPVRVNTPSASIAVRGTEFSIAVNGNETRVVVHEGLVEVGNLFVPEQRVLVEPGQGVIVHPNEALRFFIPGPNSEIGDRNGRRNDSQQPAGTPAKQGLNGNLLRNLAGQYERYIDSFVEPGETPPLLRFLALLDAHFDSLENPAFATGIHNFSGRALLLPTGRTRSAGQPRDAGLLYQSSVFVPLGRSQFVFGGSFAGTRSAVHTLDRQQLDLSTPISPAPLLTERTTQTNNQASSYNVALVLARRVGDGRTSLGAGIEYSHAHSSLAASTQLVSDATFGISVLQARESLRAFSNITRVRLRLGVTREFVGGHKFGIFFHQGTGSATDRDEKRLFNGFPLSLDAVRYASHSSEVGMRLRGALSRRWFYGLEGAVLRIGLNEEIRRAAIVPAHERESIWRYQAGGGLSFVPATRAVFSLDASLGRVHVREHLLADATGKGLEDLRERTTFVSIHAAVQVDVWRQMFASASALSLLQGHTTDRKLYPDQFGRRLTAYGFSLPDGKTFAHFTEPLADFGAGWRFKQQFALQYIYSTDFGRTAASHVLLLRFNYNRTE